MWTKATVIQTHLGPLPDFTAAEVRNYAAWDTWGYSVYPDLCRGLSVINMRATGGDYWNTCWWNSTQAGTELVRCFGDVNEDAGSPPLWAGKNTDARFDTDDGPYTLKSTVYDSTTTPHDSGTCSVRDGNMPGGSRLSCTRKVVR
jgi:hypothetical protein